MVVLKVLKSLPFFRQKVQIYQSHCFHRCYSRILNLKRMFFSFIFNAKSLLYGSKYHMPGGVYSPNDILLASGTERMEIVLYPTKLSGDN